MTADTYSSDGIGALLMGTGNDNNTWGSNANTNVFQVFADAISNALTSGVTGGTLDLSGSPPPAASSQTRYAALIFTGALLSNQLVVVPNFLKFWWVKNATSGSFTLKLKTTAGSASTAIPQNSGWQLVQCDGSNGIVVHPFNSVSIQMPDGTVSAPAYSNLTEPTSGWYRAGTQDWRLSINGVAVLQATGTGAGSPSIINVLSPNALQVAGAAIYADGSTFKAASGTVAAPGFAFNSEAGSGLYRIGAGDIGFAILGAKVGEWTAAGYAVTGALSSTGNFTVATKFSVDASNGNTVAVGTIGGTSITASAALSGATAAGAMLASQAEQETGTATNKVVQPGVQHFHPSAAKAWVRFAGNTGAIGVSYNVSSITRNSAGNYTVNFTTAFSTVNYAVIATPMGGSSLLIGTGSSSATGSCVVRSTFTDGTPTDPTTMSVVCFGDQ